MKRVVVTADDFGLSSEVNEAVRLGHERGILGCASLMVGAPAAREAVALARSRPGLKVGLHLTLVDGRPVLPPSLVPDLVDGAGRFRRGLAGPGARIFFLPRARRQAVAECRAQVEAFENTGLELDHLNGHNHFHIHPTILDAVLQLAERTRIPAVRLPCQPLSTAPAGAAWMAAVMAPWVARTRSKLRRAGIAFNDCLFGLFETGAMVESAWLRLIPQLPDGLTEVYCHPAVATVGALKESMPEYRHAEELAALLSPRVREALERSGARRVAFSEACAPAA
ncbi:MAG: hopanoid biosynthesis-associated protein HpnK [Elusimicrobia bacterium]|nr:hopanoid biosynthesis-associated protein HpnK [Elusimicrobiota bacterium]